MPSTSPTPKDDRRKLELLRNILFQEEKQQIERIDAILQQREPLAERVTPIIEEELEKFEQHFPKTYQLAVDRIIERKLEQSQAQLIDLLYPIIGKMIRKYLALQLQQLRESVEAQVQQSFLGRLRERMTGVRESDRIMSMAAATQIEEAYVVEQHSGLLLGSASSGTVVDREMIAGMLTAIKSFVEDAFQKGETNLETINYAGYQIVVQDFHTLYIALAINGSLTSKEYDELCEQLLTFAQRELSGGVKVDDPRQHARLEKALRHYFMKTPSQP
ncbi:MAG: hypothetical protein GVY26_14790 [Bacteroidetes bacterium]|nr:hypothetical protein [Bacteroidota bacterium]